MRDVCDCRLKFKIHMIFFSYCLCNRLNRLRMINKLASKAKFFSRSFSNTINTNLELKPPWKVLFFGSDVFSLFSLKSLFKAYRHGTLLAKLDVVTSFKNQRNPVLQFARTENLAVYDWPVVVEKDAYHIGVVVSFGYLIPENIINKFPLGMLNVHASLLPRWRGAAPIVYAIASGDKTTGITVMTLRPHQFDVGKIVYQERVDIPDDMKMPQLHSILADLGAKSLLKVFTHLPDILNDAVEQPASGVTLAPRLKTDFANVRWDKMTAEQVYNLARAVEGMLPVTAKWKDLQIKLFDVGKCNMNIPRYTNEMPGCVYYDKSEKVIKVKCADGQWVSVKRIGVPGKRKMSATDFKNGYHLKDSEKLYFT